MVGGFCGSSWLFGMSVCLVGWWGVVGGIGSREYDVCLCLWIVSRGFLGVVRKGWVGGFTYDFVD
jgi:hypothetical protein